MAKAADGEAAAAEPLFGEARESLVPRSSKPTIWKTQRTGVK